ncbi:ITFG2 protein, partial [Polypterus senegalus]
MVKTGRWVKERSCFCRIAMNPLTVLMYTGKRQTIQNPTMKRSRTKQGDGCEEVVACAWDGQTYIIDHNRMVVRFQFDENVNAFCAGQYACKDGRNSPCLVYVSFNHKIYVYWRVELERMESTNLLKVLDEKEEFRKLLGKLHLGTCKFLDISGGNGPSPHPAIQQVPDVLNGIEIRALPLRG